jgi:hypothetical protein
MRVMKGGGQTKLPQFIIVFFCIPFGARSLILIFIFFPFSELGPFKMKRMAHSSSHVVAL